MDEIAVVKKLVLQKLVRANVWGGKHMPLDFVTRGIPEHYRNTHMGQKVIEKTMKDLVSGEWVFIIIKRTGKGSNHHVSLNPRKVHEIRQFLEQSQ